MGKWNGKKIVVSVRDLGVAGEGIGDSDGMTVFVDGLLPHEEGEAEVFEERTNFVRGDLLKILKESPHRVDPVCPVFKRCGGCQIMHLSYPEQLKWKRQRVFDSMERIAKISNPTVATTEPSQSSLHYRNKVHLQATVQNNEPCLGMYESKSHHVVPITKCYIHNEIGEEVFEAVQEILRTSSISVYDERNHSGELRSVLFRTAHTSKQVLIMLVTTKRVSAELKDIAQQIGSLENVSGVVHGKNNVRGNTLIPDEVDEMIGESTIEETLLGLDIQLSAKSFFQVNVKQAENIYQTAMELSGVKSGDRVIDLFCGIGVFGCYLAKKGVSVTGIEVVPDAISDARENACRNNVEVDWIVGKVEDLIHDFKDFDVVFVNPPRKGCDEEVLEGICNISPKRIVYTSCNPATLARDIAFFKERGYLPKEFRPFDLFPQTVHVETVALLEKA